MTYYYANVLAVAGLLALTGCENLTSEQRTVVGVTSGAAAGLITAEAFDADDNWRLIAALAGAAAGTLVAQNSATDDCAYARGDGTYFTAPCPQGPERGLIECRSNRSSLITMSTTHWRSRISCSDASGCRNGARTGSPDAR